MQSSEQMTAAFIEQIKAGYIHPEHMASVLYEMHNSLVDRFEQIAMWLPLDLERVADSVVTAMQCAEKAPQEEEKPPRQCDEEGAVQRFEAWMREVVA